MPRSKSQQEGESENVDMLDGAASASGSVDGNDDDHQDHVDQKKGGKGGKWSLKWNNKDICWAQDKHADWYEAKIVDFISSNDARLALVTDENIQNKRGLKAKANKLLEFDATEGDWVRVHFQGWSASHDEWVHFVRGGFLCTQEKKLCWCKRHPDGIEKKKKPTDASPSSAKSTTSKKEQAVAATPASIATSKSKGNDDENTQEEQTESKKGKKKKSETVSSSTSASPAKPKKEAAQANKEEPLAAPAAIPSPEKTQSTKKKATPASSTSSSSTPKVTPASSASTEPSLRKKKSVDSSQSSSVKATDEDVPKKKSKLAKESSEKRVTIEEDSKPSVVKASSSSSTVVAEAATEKATPSKRAKVSASLTSAKKVEAATEESNNTTTKAEESSSSVRKSARQKQAEVAKSAHVVVATNASEETPAADGETVSASKQPADGAQSPSKTTRLDFTVAESVVKPDPAESPSRRATRQSHRTDELVAPSSIAATSALPPLAVITVSEVSGGKPIPVSSSSQPTELPSSPSRSATTTTDSSSSSSLFVLVDTAAAAAAAATPTVAAAQPASENDVALVATEAPPTSTTLSSSSHPASPTRKLRDRGDHSVSSTTMKKHDVATVKAALVSSGTTTSEGKDGKDAEIVGVTTTVGEPGPGGEPFCMDAAKLLALDELGVPKTAAPILQYAKDLDISVERLLRTADVGTYNTACRWWFKGEKLSRPAVMQGAACLVEWYESTLEKRPRRQVYVDMQAVALYRIEHHENEKPSASKSSSKKHRAAPISPADVDYPYQMDSGAPGFVPSLSSSSTSRRPMGAGVNGLTNVRLLATTGRWESSIALGEGKQLHRIGLFDSSDEATIAVRKAFAVVDRMMKDMRSTSQVTEKEDRCAACSGRASDDNQLRPCHLCSRRFHMTCGPSSSSNPLMADDAQLDMDWVCPICEYELLRAAIHAGGTTSTAVTLAKPSFLGGGADGGGGFFSGSAAGPSTPGNYANSSSSSSLSNLKNKRGLGGPLVASAVGAGRRGGASNANTQLRFEEEIRYTPTQDGETEWVGVPYLTPPSRIAERKAYFAAFSRLDKPDVQFRVLDHVLIGRRGSPFEEDVEEEQRNSPDFFVGQIEALWEDRATGERFMRVAWFFWPEETDPSIETFKNVGEGREVLTSFEVDTEPINRVITKTRVLSQAEFDRFSLTSTPFSPDEVLTKTNSISTSEEEKMDVVIVSEKDSAVDEASAAVPSASISVEGGEAEILMIPEKQASSESGSWWWPNDNNNINSVAAGPTAGPTTPTPATAASPLPDHSSNGANAGGGAEGVQYLSTTTAANGVPVPRPVLSSSSSSSAAGADLMSIGQTDEHAVRLDLKRKYPLLRECSRCGMWGFRTAGELGAHTGRFCGEDTPEALELRRAEWGRFAATGDEYPRPSTVKVPLVRARMLSGLTSPTKVSSRLAAAAAASTMTRASRSGIGGGGNGGGGNGGGGGGGEEDDERMNDESLNPAVVARALKRAEMGPFVARLHYYQRENRTEGKDSADDSGENFMQSSILFSNKANPQTRFWKEREQTDADRMVFTCLQSLQTDVPSCKTGAEEFRCGFCAHTFQTTDIRIVCQQCDCLEMCVDCVKIGRQGISLYTKNSSVHSVLHRYRTKQATIDPTNPIDAPKILAKICAEKGLGEPKYELLELSRQPPVPKGDHRPRFRFGVYIARVAAALCAEEYGFTIEQSIAQAAFTALRTYFGATHLYATPVLSRDWSCWEACRLMDGMLLHGLAWETVAPIVGTKDATSCRMFFSEALPAAGGVVNIMPSPPPQDDNNNNKPQKGLPEIVSCAGLDGQGIVDPHHSSKLDLPQALLDMAVSEAMSWAERVRLWRERREQGRSGLLFAVIEGSVVRIPDDSDDGGRYSTKASSGSTVCKQCFKNCTPRDDCVNCVVCSDRYHTYCLSQIVDGDVPSTKEEWYCPICLQDEKYVYEDSCWGFAGRLLCAIADREDAAKGKSQPSAGRSHVADWEFNTRIIDDATSIAEALVRKERGDDQSSKPLTDRKRLFPYDASANGAASTPHGKKDRMFGADSKEKKKYESKKRQKFLVTAAELGYIDGTVANATIKALSDENRSLKASLLAVTSERDALLAQLSKYSEKFADPTAE